jgi:uncharacterized coiled-coil DUF342 family protein
MSEQTKKNAKDVEYNLRNAEGYINEAERSAKGTGDKQLIEKVTKIRESVTETRKDLTKKLDGG